MGNFFSVDGPFYKYGSILADIMLVSLLWFLCSIPIFTIGASTTAAFDVLTRQAAGENGAILRGFWRSFKRNFGMSIRILAVVAGIALLVYANLNSMQLFEGNLKLFLATAQVVLAIELLFVGFYLFPIAARFDMKFTQIFKTSFYMANRHMLTTLAVGATLLGLVLLTAQFFLFVFLVPGIFCYVTSFLFVNVFKKYKPEIVPQSSDALPPILSLSEEEDRKQREAAFLAMEEAAKAQAKAGDEDV